MSAYWKARAEAGREVGVGPAAAYKQWGLIKAGLGWQAV